MSGGYSSNDPCQSEYANPNDHGCPITISLNSKSYGRITHTSNGQREFPTVRSYRDGIRVGCTFVTNAALEEIYKLHHSFVPPPPEYKIHQ